MKIDRTEKPFPFLLVHNFYDESELKLIWQELDFLSYDSKFEDGTKSNDFIEENGIARKKCKAIYLDNAYSNRKLSNILNVNRKLFSDEILKEFSDLNFAYKSIYHCKNDYTMINYYDNTDYYKAHFDNFSYSSITWFYKEPKQFNGGELIFTEYDYNVETLNNTMILFPSFVLHSVNPVTLSDTTTNSGRYSMAQFIK